MILDNKIGLSFPLYSNNLTNKVLKQIKGKAVYDLFSWYVFSKTILNGRIINDNNYKFSTTRYSQRTARRIL